MARRSCLLTWEAEGWWRVTFTYSLEAVEALKRTIPHHDREWHELGKCWRVKAAHEGWLVRFAKSFPMAEEQRGTVTRDLHSGRVRQQLELFDAAAEPSAPSDAAPRA